MLVDMLLSESDPEIRKGVVAITGECKCSEKYRSLWAGHATDKRDPRCAFHLCGENIASLLRDNRRLREATRRLQLHIRTTARENARINRNRNPGE